MEEKLEKLIKEVTIDLETVSKEADLLALKPKYLGKDSIIITLVQSIKDLSLEDKKTFGGKITETKKVIENLFSDKMNDLNNKPFMAFDPTLPCSGELGSLHPVTIVAKEVTDILKKIGFTIVNGPEMESEYYNFVALNIPDTHPARDMQDTYWLSNDLLLRTHTSPNQVLAMEKYGAPLMICAPGRCFRNEDLDHSHENTFFQLEGMVIDENISIGNLIKVMEDMLSEVFKKDVNVRLRPGFFPFVEPGFELDCSCTICDGKGCSTCKNSGWVELCPCGMIHPNVLKMSNIDSEKYTGFAFGLGLTRLAMMKYKINDIRILNSGDLREISKFGIN